MADTKLECSVKNCKQWVIVDAADFSDENWMKGWDIEDGNWLCTRHREPMTVGQLIKWLHNYGEDDGIWVEFDGMTRKVVMVKPGSGAGVVLVS